MWRPPDARTRRGQPGFGAEWERVQRPSDANEVPGKFFQDARFPHGIRAGSALPTAIVQDLPDRRTARGPGWASGVAVSTRRRPPAVAEMSGSRSHLPGLTH